MENANGIKNLTNLISKNQKKRMDEILKELGEQEKEELRKLRVKFANKRKKILSGKIEKKTARRKTIPKPLKNSVWDEYIGKNRGTGECQVCEKQIDSKDFECGHIISVKEGGATNVSNMVPICGTCNKSMGTMNLHQFKDSYFSDKQNVMDLCG